MTPKMNMTHFQNAYFVAAVTTPCPSDIQIIHSIVCFNNKDVFLGSNSTFFHFLLTSNIEELFDITSHPFQNRNLCVHIASFVFCVI